MQAFGLNKEKIASTYQYRIEKHPMWSLPCGQSLDLVSWHFISPHPGKKVYLQANVHGAEVQGCGVIYRLAQWLKENEFAGEFILVPHANPFASSLKNAEYTNGRIDPATGSNWNRGFINLIEEGLVYEHKPITLKEFAESHKSTPYVKLAQNFKQALKESLASYEQQFKKTSTAAYQRLALELQKLSIDADIVLDLHTAPKATRFLYSPEYAFEKSIEFCIPHILLIPDHFAGALDEASFCPWWALKKELSRQGRQEEVALESFTLEFGSQETLSLESAEDDLQGVLRYLASHNLVDLKKQKQMLESYYYCQLEDYKTLFASEGGVVDYQVKPGDIVAKNHLLAQILSLGKVSSLDNILQAESKVKNPFEGDSIVILNFPSASCHVGQELFKLMTNFKKISPNKGLNV
ncbi:MAG: hypothetical protein GWP59_02715 [Chlamydiales bacterium]|nr:hypothetical protein [Chlamydiales bacterium]